MAKKRHNLELTPLMSLSILAFFIIVIPLFAVLNSSKTVTTSKTAAAPEIEVSPSPTPVPFR